MIRKSYITCSSALVLTLAACSDSTGVNAITRADANQLAADLDASSTLGILDVGMGALFSVGVGGSAGAASVSAPTAIDNQFTITRQCPKGGQAVLAGRVTGAADQTSHSLNLESVATRTDTQCAFETRNGVLTLSGNPNIVFDGKLNIVNGALSGLQTATHKGSFTWARDGGSGTCDVDLSSAYDPTARTATVTGKFCGIDVNVTRTR